MLLKRKSVGKRVLGIDSSTQSIAYALLIDGSLEEYGQIYFNGSTVYERLKDAKTKIEELKTLLFPDLVFIEDTVQVRSTSVAIKMAYFASLSLTTFDTIKPVSPLTWQGFIGNKRLTVDEKRKILAENPGKSKSWYQNAHREFRKNRTIDWVEEKFGKRIDSNDITDAVGIAWWGSHKG